MIKIIRFVGWGVHSNDVYCSDPDPVKGKMCSDIADLHEAVERAGYRKLLVDMQNNPGGVESTPLIAAFSGNEFYDNAVQFRKTRDFESSAFVDSIFWKSDIRWLSGLRTSGLWRETQQGAYLPIRADFCRGSRNCELKPIEENKRYNFASKLSGIIVNEKCVSSCDDFVWRVSDNTGVDVYGQTPATDGTYSRVFGSIRMNDKGALFALTSGDRFKITSNSSLVEFMLPFSRTVTRTGVLLEGNATVLDVPIPIRKERFLDRDAATVDSVYKAITSEAVQSALTAIY